MNATFKTAALLAATCLFLSVVRADTTEAGESGSGKAPGAMEKTENAIERGAKATANGIERGTKAAVRGVKRGAKAAAGGIERGAQATGRAAHKVARKTGLSKTSDTEAESTKP